MANLKTNYNKFLHKEYWETDFSTIKNLISLREEYWENDFSTNCYAFALGLDIPENQIIKDAYQLGIIGAIAKHIPIEEIKKLTFEERLILDLNVLGIKEEISNIDDNSEFFFTSNYIYKQWVISLLSNGKNFHFIRKSYNGIWYQKWGYYAPVTKFDFDKKVITNPNEANFEEYKLVKTYKLSFREKIN